MSPVCFVAGTRILTTRGEVPVEGLSVGNLAVSPTGALSNITWLGWYEVDLRVASSRADSTPVKVSRNALADGVPHRDLLLSADHSLFIDDILIPVRVLKNGLSIGPADGFGVVTYWHVELAQHGILLAEGAATESYLEWNNRSQFTHTQGCARPTRSVFAAPYASKGEIVDAARRRLRLRAEALDRGERQYAVPVTGPEALGRGIGLGPP